MESGLIMFQRWFIAQNNDCLNFQPEVFHKSWSFERIFIVRKMLNVMDCF